MLFLNNDRTLSELIWQSGSKKGTAGAREFCKEILEKVTYLGVGNFNEWIPGRYYKTLLFQNCSVFSKLEILIFQGDAPRTRSFSFNDKAVGDREHATAKALARQMTTMNQAVQ
jgi:hypothetical protein